MDKKFLEATKNTLLSQRAVLVESLAAQNEDLRNLVKTTESGDIVDIASDAVDRTLLDTLSAQDSARLRQIENALEKIREGNYGICANCGQEIPEARLKALPFAVMCVPCTEAQERGRR